MGGPLLSICRDEQEVGAMKLVCCCHEPRTRDSLSSLDPPESHLCSPGSQCQDARGAVHLRKDASRTDASQWASPRHPGLPSCRGQPLCSPEPTRMRVEAGSRSFVFISWKDSNYQSTLHTCSPGEPEHTAPSAI